MQFNVNKSIYNFIYLYFVNKLRLFLLFYKNFDVYKYFWNLQTFSKTTGNNKIVGNITQHTNLSNSY